MKGSSLHEPSLSAGQTLSNRSVCALGQFPGSISQFSSVLCLTSGLQVNSTSRGDVRKELWVAGLWELKREQ